MRRLNVLAPTNWLAYDKTDEIAAYKRQGIFGSTHSTLPKEYSNRPAGPVNLRSIPSIQNLLNSSQQAQQKGFSNISNATRMAFRINRTTYAPPK